MRRYMVSEVREEATPSVRSVVGTIVSTSAFVLSFLMFCLSPAAQGYEQNYLPLTPAELSRRFPQRRIVFPIESGAHARIGTSTVQFQDDGKLVISGKDDDAREWSVGAEWNTLGCEFFTADLDHNGKEDLIVAIPTGGNGSAPSIHLLILLFDVRGRPIPSEFDGYFDYDAQGVKDLLDLNQDGRAELVRQSFNDGYWITSLYEVRSAHWFPVQGKYGSRTYPLYTRFTTRPNRIATVPARNRNPQDADLSNSAILAQVPVHIMKLQWANVEESQDPTVVLSDGRVCRPVAWYSTLAVIIDQETGRESAILSDAQDSKRLLEVIAREKLPVRISGHRPPRNEAEKVDDCVPELIWAGTPPVQQ